MQWYLGALQKYVQFSGRARRTEYWMFVFCNILISAILAIIQALFEWSLFLTNLYSWFILLPFWALTVRRLHDSGKSGWWLLIGFIPYAGVFVLFVFSCLDSEGDNQYGPSPKY